MIAIVDYGMGNLRSVEKGFAKVGHETTVTNVSAAGLTWDLDGTTADPGFCK